MKKQLAALCLIAAMVCALLPGCAEPQAPVSTTAPTENGRTGVEPVGQIPDAFQNIIENNLFSGVTAYDGRLLKSEVRPVGKDTRTVAHRVWMMDVYGKELASWECTTDLAYGVTTLTATEDGGFLFVLGFSDYAYGQDSWASDQGFASRVIKCDREGNVQFDAPFPEVEGAALRYCFEQDGRFWFFGTIQTPEDKVRGVWSATDVYMTVLDQTGTVVDTRLLAGSDFDSLDMAEVSGDGFVLSVSSQSDDGDFAGSGSGGYSKDWVVTVDNRLAVTEKRMESGRDYFDFRLGERNGVAVHRSDALLKDFDAGTPEAFIDYGDFYLIISENETGIYEKTPPFISALWYYTETVYSAYDPQGNLIFRAAVDSSPDYDALVESWSQ